MALTRKFLSAMGIEAEKIDEIITAHSDTVSALKEERDNYKQDAEKSKVDSEELERLKTENQELKDAKSNTDSDWEKKYNDLKSEYDTYKNDVEEKAVKQNKIDAFKKLLKDANVSEKRIDAILKVSGDTIDSIEFDDDKNVKDSDKIMDGIKNEWAEFIVEKKKVGADTNTPPTNVTGGPKSESRAAKLAEQYHNSIYGETKKED